jgi:hypothetical protein
VKLIVSLFIGSNHVYLVRYGHVPDTFFIRFLYTIIICVIKNITTDNTNAWLGIQPVRKENKKQNEQEDGSHKNF